MAYTIGWNPSPAPSSVEVVATVADPTALQQLAPEAVFSPIHDLVSLAGVGGLSGDQHRPQEAVARLLTQRVSGRHVEWSFEVAELANNCLQHIEGALAYFDAELGELRSVSVRAPSQLVAARAQPPERHASLPFQFFDDRQEYLSLRAEVRFSEPISEHLMQRVEGEAFGTWLCAASAGVFCNEEYPPDSIPRLSR